MVLGERRQRFVETKIGGAVSADRGVRIALSGVQVAQVVRRISDRASFTGLLPEAIDGDGLRRVVLPLLDSHEYSCSTCRSLLVLTTFLADGSEAELTDVASEPGLSPNTTHRYIAKWMATGVHGESSSRAHGDTTARPLTPPAKSTLRQPRAALMAADRMRGYQRSCWRVGCR
jgi:hypothetical protein